ncbi:MAG TPA: hypothetical protein VHW60_10160 [Caulobacteraceae bacterium]|jgi:hypothetical protein|nr:hypothetical protein [Caulobacteraceae bacterium]
MKLSQLLAGATALAFAAGVASSAFAAPAPTTNVPFALSGSVASSCLMSFASTSVPVGNNGVIPIDTNAADTSTYFHMTDANDYGLEAGFAGCNTASTVSVVKTNGANGLETNNTSAFDKSVLQNNLPYSVQFGFDHGANGDPVTVSAAGATITNQPAFSGSANISVVIPQATLGLVSGTYTDTVTVTLTATG